MLIKTELVRLQAAERVANSVESIQTPSGPTLLACACLAEYLG